MPAVRLFNSTDLEKERVWTQSIFTQPIKVSSGNAMSTDKRGTNILARTFFNQLSTGYTPHQILDIAIELIDLVTNSIRPGKTSVIKSNTNAESLAENLPR